MINNNGIIRDKLKKQALVYLKGKNDVFFRKGQISTGASIHTISINIWNDITIDTTSVPISLAASVKFRTLDGGEMELFFDNIQGQIIIDKLEFVRVECPIYIFD